MNKELEDRPNEPGIYSVKYFVKDDRFASGLCAYESKILAISWGHAQEQANDLGMELTGLIIEEFPTDNSDWM